MTLEEYLTMAMQLGFTGFQLNPTIDVDGNLSFGIQPTNARGVMKHFSVEDNHLSELKVLAQYDIDTDL
jgi:hypothetical protein